MTRMVDLNKDLEKFLVPAFKRKAKSVAALDVSLLTSYTDTIIIITCMSSRQTNAVAEYIYRELKNQGIKALGTEGVKEGNWALLDFGSVVIHVFDEDTSQVYDLEGLWSDAPKIDIASLESQYPLEN